jgi:hypothetical protein
MAVNTPYSLPSVHDPWNDYAPSLAASEYQDPSFAFSSGPSTVGYAQHVGLMMEDGATPPLPLPWDEGFLAFWTQTAPQFPQLGSGDSENVMSDVNSGGFVR